MALIRNYFFSETLQINTSMTIIFPQLQQVNLKMNQLIEKHGFPTLYLLHGLFDDDITWIRRTSIESYVDSLGLAVVMPQVGRSYYTDMVYGPKYWTFLSEEVPKITRTFFRLSDKREYNFVAGVSMGGYGALKWALSRPKQFMAVASLSGRIDIAKLSEDPLRVRDYKLIFDNQTVEDTENDLFWLLKNFNQNKSPKPKVYISCGIEDDLYGENLMFCDALQDAAFDCTFDEGLGGHEWSYWDQKIQDVLDWLVYHFLIP